VRLSRLEVRDVRIVQEVSLRPHPSLSVITGGNGAGKTSLLEAIHVLGTGRSFRSREVDTLVRWGCRELSVFAEAQGADGEVRRLGIVKGGSDARARVDGRPLEGIAPVARLLPLATFGPETIDVVDGPPERRRALMDWALFHVEPRYGDSVLRYRRALRQRNAVLRGEGSRQEARVWEVDLCGEGTRVDEMRAGYSDAVLPYVADALASLSPLDLRLVYRRGWPASETLQQALDRGWGTDVTRGWTGSGPHLADLSLQVGGRSARDTLSRGEKKALAAALVLGHVEFLLAAGPGRPILLADDFASELDDRARAWFLRRALATGCQLVFSLLAGETLTLPDSLEHAVFQVERGEVREML
jgi:DNA replication and repair protein RecF